jgi:hypothetical protein
LDKGLQTDVVFMNIAKAFVTVDNSKLLKKLQEFGFSAATETDTVSVGLPVSK